MTMFAPATPVSPRENGSDDLLACSKGLDPELGLGSNPDSEPVDRATTAVRPSPALTATDVGLLVGLTATAAAAAAAAAAGLRAKAAAEGGGGDAAFMRLRPWLGSSPGCFTPPAEAKCTAWRLLETPALDRPRG